MANGIIVIDEKLKITGINRAALKIFNLGQEETVQNGHFLEINNSDLLFQQLKQTIETGKLPRMVVEHNFLSLKKAGSDYYCQFSLTPMRSEEGELSGIILLLINVSKAPCHERS